ncbi:unnamed protein product [Dovyalis caffra]|uniref:Uncharacterized protein n=1 Tax=Dovyalis caffra TaxID=77055 RepID=A0AAV1S5S9_9ROSI|nr:unnamed protein product [Dovyalis caffra]
MAAASASLERQNENLPSVLQLITMDATSLFRRPIRQTSEKNGVRLYPYREIKAYPIISKRVGLFRIRFEKCIPGSAIGI